METVAHSLTTFDQRPSRSSPFTCVTVVAVERVETRDLGREGDGAARTTRNTPSVRLAYSCVVGFFAVSEDTCHGVTGWLNW